MAIPENQYPIIWKAIQFWMQKYNLDEHHFSLLTAGGKEPYPPARIARGIDIGTEFVSSDLLHCCVRVFSLTSARDRGLVETLTDDVCIKLLTDPVIDKPSQTAFQL